MQLKPGVKSQNPVGAQLARRGEAVDHHPLDRQMGRYGGKHLATDPLDVASPQVMPEQAGDIGGARRMAEGRRKLSPGEDRMSRQEACGLVLARLHGRSMILRCEGYILALTTHICQLAC